MRNAQAESPILRAIPAISASLGHAIEEFLRALADFQRQGREGADHPGPRFIVWEDEDYQYVESAVDHSEISICDLNIVGGKIYIRIAREPEAEEPPEFLPLLRATFPIDVPIEA